MLRMTLGDMPLEDAFEVETSFAADTTLGSLIDATFPPDPREQRQIRRLLDHRTNPDLPDMYDALIELLDHWRKRRCDLRFFVNHGAEVTLDGRIDGWLAERGAAPPPARPRHGAASHAPGLRRAPRLRRRRNSAPTLAGGDPPSSTSLWQASWNGAHLHNRERRAGRRAPTSRRPGLREHPRR